jgi:hypothetical protein
MQSPRQHSSAPQSLAVPPFATHPVRRYQPMPSRQRNINASVHAAVEEGKSGVDIRCPPKEPSDRGVRGEQNLVRKYAGQIDAACAPSSPGPSLWPQSRLVAEGISASPDRISSADHVTSHHSGPRRDALACSSVSTRNPQDMTPTANRHTRETRLGATLWMSGCISIGPFTLHFGSVAAAELRPRSWLQRTI